MTVTDVRGDPLEMALQSPTPYSRRQVLLVFVGLMVGILLAALDQTIVATALPTIGGDLGGLDDVTWIVTSYLLATTITAPLYGKLGDLYGRKQLFQAAIAIFLVGSLLCALAPSFWALVAFRAVQGIGAGGLMVLALAIIADVVSPRERGRYQGLFGALFGMASVVGPLLGGFITDRWSWHWVFVINLPFGLAALVITGMTLPPSRRRATTSIDWPGAALLTVLITSVVLITEWGGNRFAWGSPTMFVLIAVALAALASFIAVERRSVEPLLPLRLFRTRTFTLATVLALLVGLAMYSVVNTLPQYLQTVNGVSATNSGLLLVPLMIGVVTASITAGQLVSRTGRYRMFPIAGMTIATIGFICLGTLDGSSGRAEITLFMVITGIGIGQIVSIVVIATQNEVPAGDLGVATASVSFFRSIGGSVGFAFFGALFTSRIGRDLLTLEELDALPVAARQDYVDHFGSAVGGTFRLIVPLLVVGVMLALCLRERPLREQTHHVSPSPVGEPVAG